ncbi:helix-turn-helix domain-containing protein [Pseudoroseicyclus sp. H15]
MDVIDGAWLKRRLRDGSRGEKARLAEAMGISTQQLSKVLAGTRAVQAEEIPAVLSYFGMHIADGERDGSEPPGFSEAAVEPYEADRSGDIGLLISLAGKRIAHPMTFRLKSDAKDLALMRGDLLIVDAKGDRRVGELVICTMTDDYGNEATQVRKWLDPWLIVGNEAAHIGENSHTIGILGRVVGLIRGSWIA